eukprot:gb/GECH01005837.1/.p1 GENE.gb/GECH01005837.1/~~gb/GECH01005837.1/.p1  ORF type:complete len:101 (+),score=9.15 gb/GECH01005837.1/:1-303(+)
MVQARRIGDYVDFIGYFTLFCLVVPVWLKSALVWVDKSRESFSHRLRIMVYVTLIILNILFIISSLPLFALAIYELLRPSSAPTVASTQLEVLFVLRHQL